MFGLLEQFVSSSHQLDDGFVEPGEVTSFYLGGWDCLFHNRQRCGARNPMFVQCSIEFQSKHCIRLQAVIQSA